MVLTIANVRVGVSGEISVGPTTSAAPTTTTSVLTGFLGLGYVGEDGITETVDRSTDDIIAWQNATTVRTVVTDAKTTYEFPLIETNKAVVEFVTGAIVTQTATHGTYVADPAATGGRKSFVFDIIDGANLKRIYIAAGELTERGETVYASGEPVGYECTVTAYSAPQIFDTALKTP